MWWRKICSPGADRLEENSVVYSPFFCALRAALARLREAPTQLLYMQSQCYDSKTQDILGPTTGLNQTVSEVPAHAAIRILSPS